MPRLVPRPRYDQLYGAVLELFPILEVRIDAVENDYDFEATALAVVSSPVTMERRAGRALPMLATSIGSFGR